MQVAEGAEAAEDLPQLVEEPLPDPHRAGGVEDQLEQGLTAVDGPEDGQHQPPARAVSSAVAPSSSTCRREAAPVRYAWSGRSAR